MGREFEKYFPLLHFSPGDESSRELRKEVRRWVPRT